MTRICTNAEWAGGWNCGESSSFSNVSVRARPCAAHARRAGLPTCRFTGLSSPVFQPLIVLLLLALTSLAHADDLSPVKVNALTCEHLVNPMGIANTQPRLSWKLRSDRQGEVQTAYEVRAASSVIGLTESSPDLWDSGQVMSDQSILVPWGGKALGSRSQVFWQVRVWGKDTAVQLI